MLLHSHIRLLALVPALALSAALSGCNNSSPADDPSIRSRFNTLTAQIEELQAQLDNAGDNIASLTTQIEELTASGAGGTPPAELAALRSANQEMSNRIAQLETQVSQAVAASARREPPPQTADAQAASPLAADRESGSMGSSRDTSAPPAQATAAAAEPRDIAPPARARGVNHTVAQGETLDAIAQRFNTTPAAIREANALPPNAQPYAGTQLLIPQQ